METTKKLIEDMKKRNKDLMDKLDKLYADYQKFIIQSEKDVKKMKDKRKK